jgi:hypothetical protein
MLFILLIYEKFIVILFHSTFLIATVSTSNSLSIYTSTSQTRIVIDSIKRSRQTRDTYDEREKLVSTYRIISKTQCLLQMRSVDGYVHATHVTTIDQTAESKLNTILRQYDIRIHIESINVEFVSVSVNNEDRQCLVVWQRPMYFYYLSLKQYSWVWHTVNSISSNVVLRPINARQCRS